MIRLYSALRVVESHQCKSHFSRDGVTFSILVSNIVSMKPFPGSHTSSHSNYDEDIYFATTPHIAYGLRLCYSVKQFGTGLPEGFALQVVTSTNA